MPLFDHLRELRNRIVKMALALIVGMIAGFIFFDQAWRVIERPLCHTTVNGHSGCATPGVNQLILNSPLDPFYLRVKVAFVVGVLLSSPVWLYQLWAFIAPGLYAREKRWGRLFLGTAVPLFLIGNVLAYLSLGRSMHYLLGLTPAGVGNYIQVDLYMSLFKRHESGIHVVSAGRRAAIIGHRNVLGTQKRQEHGRGPGRRASQHPSQASTADPACA